VARRLSAGTSTSATPLKRSLSRRLGAVPQRARSDHGTELATSGPERGVETDAGWEPRIAGKMAARRVFHGGWSRDFRAVSPSSQPTTWIHSGWSYSNAQFPLRRFADDLTILAAAGRWECGVLSHPEGWLRQMRRIRPVRRRSRSLRATPQMTLQ
jgi:hypothetical protein